MLIILDSQSLTNHQLKFICNSYESESSSNDQYRYWLLGKAKHFSTILIPSCIVPKVDIFTVVSDTDIISIIHGLIQGYFFNKHNLPNILCPKIDTDIHLYTTRLDACEHKLNVDLNTYILVRVHNLSNVEVESDVDSDM